MRTSSKITGAAVAALLVIAVLVWSAAISADHRGVLTVSFLDTGKGSAVFITAPSGNTALIDGGPDAGILRAIAGELPWWQRNIDVVIAAHPDAAHATGLIDVLQRYSVGRVFTSSTSGTGPVWATFEKTLADAQSKGAVVATLKRGQVVDLGSGAFIEILFPDRDVSSALASYGCIEMKLVYGATAFMLSCGASAIEDYLVRLDGTHLHADVLYASAASTSSPQATSPLFAGFVGAQFNAQSGESFVSDGSVVTQR